MKTKTWTKLCSLTYLYILQVQAVTCFSFWIRPSTSWIVLLVFGEDFVDQFDNFIENDKELCSDDKVENLVDDVA